MKRLSECLSSSPAPARAPLALRSFVDRARDSDGFGFASLEWRFRRLASSAALVEELEKLP